MSTINVKHSIHEHADQVFKMKLNGKNPIDFLERLYEEEFKLLRSQASVLNTKFLTSRHRKAFELIVSYCLDKLPLTETIAILSNHNFEADHDIIDHNLLLLAHEVNAYENTWWFWKKRHLVKEVREILRDTDESSKTEASQETLTSHG